jgi:hypothetical protein
MMTTEITNQQLLETMQNGFQDMQDQMDRRFDEAAQERREIARRLANVEVHLDSVEEELGAVASAVDMHGEYFVKLRNL